MAVKRQQNWLGQQRVDVADLRAIESGVSADFDLLGGKLVAGRAPLIVRGFSINTTNAAGNPADSLQLSIASGILMHFGAAESGTLFSVDDGTAAEVLSTTNAKVEGSFTASSTNYIGLDLRRSEDTTTSDLKQFLDADTKLEVPKTVPTARTLNFKIIISTQPFSISTNVCPIAKVVTNASNIVTQITDARPMLFRLGSGSDNPNPVASYTWRDLDRRENAVTYNPPTSTTDPFVGGDKDILSLKEWMDAMMSTLWEAKSGEFWYSPTARDNVKMLFGTPVIPATGDNFQWTSGTSTLAWQSLKVAFENSTGYYNVIQDGSAILSADGQCLYVDIQRQTNGAVLVPAVGSLLTLGTPVLPGSRFVLAWRQDNLIHIRDKAYEVGRTVPVATSLVVGTVKLSREASTPAAPIVIADTGGTVLPASTAGALGTDGIVATGGTSTNVVGQGGNALKGTGGAGNTGAGTGGIGVYGIGGAGVGGNGVGVRGDGRGGGPAGQNGSTGILANGGAGSATAGGDGGAGLTAQGGSALAGSSIGAPGVIALGGNGFTTGAGGPGIQAQGGAPGSGDAGGHGVVGFGAGTEGYGVVGIGVGGSFSTTDVGDQSGVYGIASGDGAGVKGQGSSTSGSFGVKGIGGATATQGRNGVIGLGGSGSTFGGIGTSGIGGDSATAAGPGVAGAGGTGGALGGDGVVGTGGSTNGIGVKGIGGASNGRGGQFTGAGTGAGVVGFSSAATAGTPLTNTGGSFFGSNAGLYARGIGASAIGAFIVGDATGNSRGAEIVGYGTEPAIWAYDGVSAVNKTIIKADGYVEVNSSDPAATTGFTDTVTSKNIVKAWADVTVPTAAGACTVNDAFNITSVTVNSSGIVTVTIANDMASANYAVALTNQDNGGTPTWLWSVSSKTTGTVLVQVYSWNGSSFSAQPIGGQGSAVAGRFMITITGAQ